MSDVTWLSYTELAERLGIGRQSARQLAIRKRWMRKPGNDGQARVGVPLEALTRPETCKPTRPATVLKLVMRRVLKHMLRPLLHRLMRRPRYELRLRALRSALRA